MSEKFLEFTGRVTSVELHDDKFYAIVRKKIIYAVTETDSGKVIEKGVEFYVTKPRDIYDVYSAFIANKECAFKIPHDQVVGRWSLPEDEVWR